MKVKNDSEQTMIYIKLLLEKTYALKYFYLACILFFVSVAFVYNKYSYKVYAINTTIGSITEINPSVVDTKSAGFGYNTGRSVEDALSSLSSFSLISSTLKDLNFEVGYFSEKNNLFKQTNEMYLNSPVQVYLDKSSLQPINTRFYVTILDDSTFRLSAYNKQTSFCNFLDNKIVRRDVAFEIDTLCKFNKMISNRNLKFSVAYDKKFISDNNDKDPKDLYFFEFYYIDDLTKLYLDNLNVSPVSYLAAIINIQYRGNNIEKSITFLNTFVNSFLEENLAKKNKIAINTVNFIDSQISELSDSLAQSESKLRNFKTTNKMMDISNQGQRLYEQLAMIESQQNEVEAKSRYFNYIINYFKTNQDLSGVVPPTSSNINDPINQLIADLIKLLTERSGIVAGNNNEKNIFLNQIENKIKIQKQAIIDNVTNNLTTLNITTNELNYRHDKLSREIANLPRTEMNMVNIQRRFNLNDANYTYLLQKRSEAAISLASNSPDYKIFEPARESTAVKIRPRKKFNYMVSLFMGLLIPTMFLVARVFFNNKISNVYDLEQLHDRSVFGIIYKNAKKYESVVTESPGSAISESFRNLRSSLLLKLKSDQSKVILITSSQPQDGKSFIAYNLAASIASVGHKTVLMDCDLRRPILHKKFKKDNSSGISNFVTKNASADEIIHKTSNENLFFIPTGPLLPNPSELIEAGVMDDLINLLKTRFEYIIIDTPPVGLVSDSIQLMRYATLSLIVSRNNVTQKDILANAFATLNSNKIDNYEVILNDFDLEKSPYSAYKGYYSKE